MRIHFYKSKEFFRLGVARMRAHAYRIQGVTMGPKCLLGKGVRIENPWTVQMGKRCVLEPFVWLNVVRENAKIRIGEYTFIGRGTELGVSNEINIGKNCLISPAVFITDHNHGMEMGKPMNAQETKSARVEIGDDVWIGAKSIILPGVHIDSGAVVGAGAVVRNNVPAYAIVAGVPSKIIRYRNKV